MIIFFGVVIKVAFEKKILHQENYSARSCAKSQVPQNA